MDSDTTHATHMNMYHERARREREMEAEIQRLKAALHEQKAVMTEIYVNVREIRRAAIGKDSESIRSTFFGMTDEILTVITTALKGEPK